MNTYANLSFVSKKPGIFKRTKYSDLIDILFWHFQVKSPPDL